MRLILTYLANLSWISSSVLLLPVDEPILENAGPNIQLIGSLLAITNKMIVTYMNKM